MSEETNYPPLNLKLAGHLRMPTSWILEGTEKDPEPVRMDFPSTYRICPTSKIKRRDGKPGYEEIRHIMGCEYIYPEDQAKYGFKPDPIFDNIFITNGNLIIHREGSAVGTYDYLKAYQGNANNKLRPDDAEIEYEEVIGKDIAIAKVADFNMMMEAMGLLQPIRVSRGDGTYDFNTETLQELCTLFNLDTDTSPEEQFAELVEIARTNPERIVNTAINPLKVLVLDIKKADKLDLIRFEPDRVFYTNDLKVVIMPFRVKMTKEKQIEALAKYLTLPANSLHLEQLRVLISERESTTLSAVQ